jgi:hypothetical protein
MREIMNILEAKWHHFNEKKEMNTHTLKRVM